MTIKEMTENEIDQISGGLAQPIDDLQGSKRPRPCPIPWPNPESSPKPYPYPDQDWPPLM
jgi:hypothetical protein